MMMSKLGKKLIVAAREGVAIARGEADPSTYRLHIPSEIDVKAMRKKLGMTQEAFALRYGLTLACVRDWEQSRNAPTGPMRAYLKVIEKEPEAVERALAMA
jgi:putative transcriptional regulator